MVLQSISFGRVVLHSTKSEGAQRHSGDQWELQAGLATHGNNCRWKGVPDRDRSLHQFRRGMHSQFAADALAMSAYRTDAQRQKVCDVLGGFASADQQYYLRFSYSEEILALFRRLMKGCGCRLLVQGFLLPGSSILQTSNWREELSRKGAHRVPMVLEPMITSVVRRSKAA